MLTQLEFQAGITDRCSGSLGDGPSLAASIYSGKLAGKRRPSRGAVLRRSSWTGSHLIF